MEYSTGHLDYVARSFLDDLGGAYSKALADTDMRIPPTGAIRAVRVRELGRMRPRVDQSESGTASMRYNSEDVLAGCSGAGTPILFMVTGEPDAATISIGTYPAMSERGDGVADDRLANIRALLASSYPGGVFEPEDAVSLVGRVGRLVAGGHLGVLTGFPTLKYTEDMDQPGQIDRLLRAMAGRTWGITVMAEPLGRSLTGELHHAVINEMRGIENAEQTKPRRGPLAEAYFHRLELLGRELEQGGAAGMWTAAVYYYAPDRATFATLGATLSSCYGGDDSFPDPIRPIAIEQPGKLALALGPMVIGTTAPPGEFEYPYSFQTLLTTRRLSGLIHMPSLEAPGFVVRDSSRFDVSPPATDGNAIDLGRVLDRGTPLEHSYRLSKEGLNKHALLVGVTGSGKTNTTFQIVSRLWASGIPFMVVEPSKTEYRRLLDHAGVGDALQVFTLGNERLSPFRMNPFEVAPGVSLSTHIDLLKSVFNAAFSMWTVLPQILEASLHQVYRDYGWDTVRSSNERLAPGSSRRADAFPTMGDLEQTVRSVVDRLGYEPNTTSELKAALVTRIQSLRVGGKGRMLDTRTSYPVAKLLERPTVLELEEIGDDDEKAFVIGILLSRLYEHWRSEGLRPDTPLRHVVVIEEAHRLLANVRFDPNPEVANTRGKAVETFVNMLSEVRAYGQGFIVVEQIPSKLAPDVVKNTNIKVMHRTVSGEDRLVLADATNMTEEQAGMLATLTVGQAAVFSEGDDRPILVGMDPFRRDGGERVASDLDSAIAASTAKLRDKLDAAPGRVGDVRADATDWDRALEVAEAPSVQRAVATYVLGVVERGTEGLDALDGIVAEGRRLQPGLKESPEYLRSLVVRGIDLHLRSLGGSYGWSFDEIAQVRDGLTPLVLDRLDVRLAGKAGEDPGALEGPVATVAEQYRGACRRTFDPYPACSAICDQDPPLCLYRHHAASSVGDDGVFRQFTSIIHSDEELAAVAPRLVEMCLATADRFAGPGLPAASRVRAGLCFATQVLEERIDVTPATRVRIGAELLTVARSTQD